MLDFAKDKALWDKVRSSPDFKQHRQEILEIYENAFKTEPRPHSVEEVLENNDHGLWLTSLKQLESAALMSLIYPDNEEYYNNLLRIIWAYCNEYTWAPLGHYTMQYYGKTPADFDCGLIDIFAASAAFSIAEIKNLFEERFPQLLKDRISYELRRRIIEPYRERRFFWEKHDNNWTAVCMGGVGSVLLYESPEVYYENRDRIHASMECYLASYKDDGMCVEGIGYWGFGFGFFSAFALLEREITKGEVDWFERPKVKEIAKFLQKTFLQKDVLLTYGDCNIKQNYHFCWPHMLRHIYGDMIEKIPADLGTVRDCTHFNFLLRSVIYYDINNVSEDVNTDVTYSVKGSAYFIKRTKSYGFTCKGGNNAESHNHVDVGTFILARGNKQIICDVGGGQYEEGYHFEKRYTFFHPSAISHNLPIIDNEYQSQFGIGHVPVDYNEETNTASMDIAIAYRKENVRSIERSFAFTDDTVTLTDKYDITTQSDITEHFVSVIEPKIAEGVAVIDGVKLIQPEGIIPVIVKKEVKSHTGVPHDVFLIDYILDKGATSFVLKFEMK